MPLDFSYRLFVTMWLLSDGEYKALILEMSLGASTYATMALREILKHDTSPQVQAAQSAAYHKFVENKETIADKSETNSDDKNTQSKKVEEEVLKKSDKIDEKMDVDPDPKESAENGKCLISETEMQVEPAIDDIEMSQEKETTSDVSAN